MSDYMPVNTPYEVTVTDITAFMDGIPALPVIVAHILELTQDDDLSLLSLAHAVEADPGLTSKVLRVSNSAYYAPAERVYTVRDAIRLVGFEAVRSLAVTTTVVGEMWAEHDIFDRQAFWRHSLRCGLFARRIAEAVQSGAPDILFTLGVLHDIGRAALIQYDPEQYRRVMCVMKSDGLLLWKAEKKMLGIHHGTVGGMLAEKWKLPPTYASVIAFHHEPELADDDQELAQIIALADSMAHAANIKDRQGYTTAPLVADLWKPLGLAEDAVRGIYAEREYIEHHTRSLYETAAVG